MRFHAFGLANIPTRKENSYEPFTGLGYNMSKMLHDNGHQVFFYGAEGSNPPCTEMINIVPAELMKAGLEMETTGVPKAAWCNYADSPTWRSFIENGRRELQKRYQTGDIALIGFGRFQEFVTEVELYCEFICGYSGIFTKHKVFPSHAWRHYLYGELKMESTPNWFDAVIPHYLDLNDFPVQTKKDDYLLFMGRLCPQKGPHIAADIANRSGQRLIVAGVDQTTHGIPDWLPRTSNIEYVGYVNAAKRLELMRGAKALLHPCTYLEPFGLVLIEALACGTPVICSNWGALPEIVDQGVTGYCCEDMEEFLYAVDHVHCLNPIQCRNAAEKRFSLEAAYPQYMKYFRRLQKTLAGGWYETKGTWRGPEVESRLPKDHQLRGAEIGVDRGSLSGYLLRECPNVNLIMVDTWEVFPADSDYAKSGDTVCQRTLNQRYQDWQAAMHATNDSADRRQILQMRSVEAAKLVSDGSLDFVFLDADHSYPGIKADIALWAPKIKPDGLLGGHDVDHPCFPTWGVRQAIDEFAAKTGKTIELGADFTWFITL